MAISIKIFDKTLKPSVRLSIERFIFFGTRILFFRKVPPESITGLVLLLLQQQLRTV